MHAEPLHACRTRHMPRDWISKPATPVALQQHIQVACMRRTSKQLLTTDDLLQMLNSNPMTIHVGYNMTADGVPQRDQEPIRMLMVMILMMKNNSSTLMMFWKVLVFLFPHEPAAGNMAGIACTRYSQEVLLSFSCIAWKLKNHTHWHMLDMLQH